MQSLVTESKPIKICVGVDPDSEANGIAIYKDGELIALHEWTTVTIVKYLEEIHGSCEILFSIENVLANNFVYARNSKATKAAEAKVGLCIGQCQQAQTELMRWLDEWSVPYVLHKPQKGNWYKDRALFEKATGWKKQSNEDTRSAAYFGYLAI